MKIINKEITNIFIYYEAIFMMYKSSLRSNVTTDLPIIIIIILEFYTSSYWTLPVKGKDFYQPNSFVGTS